MSKTDHTEKVNITHYDNGTTTQAPVEEEVRVPMSIKTMEQFEEYEDYLKQVTLKDREGDYWAYLDGQWCWAFRSSSSRRAVFTSADSETIARNLPLTVIENVGD